MELLSLAGRFEAATENDRELFEDAFRLCFPKPSRIWVTDAAGSWTQEYTDWQQRQAHFYGLLEAGASLDAAMSLVPEGWSKLIQDSDFDGAICELWHEQSDSEANTRAKTWPLALTAASLRARAAMETNDG